MRKVVRFILILLVAAAVITIVGRTCSDWDLPAEQDPHDLLRGLGAWVAAIFIAVLDLLLARRRSRQRK
jgi:hypothetical protein